MSSLQHRPQLMNRTPGTPVRFLTIEFTEFFRSLIKFEAPTGKTEWYRMVPLKELNKRDASKKRNEVCTIRRFWMRSMSRLRWDFRRYFVLRPLRRPHVSSKFYTKLGISSQMKVITFGVNIGEHDLKVKAKQAAKWISQNMEVRVAVSGETLTSVEQLVRIESRNQTSRRVFLTLRQERSHYIEL